MNYLRIYNMLIEKRKNDPANKYGYSEKHHIIPSSLGGSDDEFNMVHLTAREHFIAHCLLYEIYKDDTIQGVKMFRAVSMMRKNKTGNRYFNSKIYEMLRINHNLSFKLSPEQEYYRAEHFKISFNKRRNGEPDYVIKLEDRLDTEYRYCKCGCKEQFLCKISSDKQYIYKHAQRDTQQKTKDKLSDSLTKYLSTLSEEEKKERYNNSCGKADQKKRAESISKGKKGKKTNQNLIEEIKYGNMTEKEFNEYISGRTVSVMKRMTTKRNRYLENIKLNNLDVYKGILNDE